MADQFTRNRNKMIKVTFPDGKVICYRNVTDTFLDVLYHIGVEVIIEANLQLCHLPLICQKFPERLKQYMKPLTDGWFVNTQSNTDQKFLQLKSINTKQNLGLQIEIGTEFTPTEAPKVRGKSKKANKLLVKMPNGEFIGGENPIDTYLETLWALGIDEIKKKNIEFLGRTLITTYKKYDGQIQVDVDRWAFIPVSTKDKYKVLFMIGKFLNKNVEITII